MNFRQCHVYLIGSHLRVASVQTHKQTVLLPLERLEANLNIIAERCGKNGPSTKVH
jgi:hypothetical protein